MPSLPYLTDTSTQLTGTYTASTATLDNFITSNYVSNVSNLLITNINTKQATLTAATNLVGIGSAITALDYTKITINKPTNFQADWTSTVINKPSTFPADMTNIYSKTETNNLLSAKEASLTFSSPLTRTTNTIGINLSSYSTTGNDANYLLKTGGTMTGAIVNTSTTASDFKGLYIMHAARQTHIPYIPDGKIYFRAPLIIDHPDDYISMGSKIADHIIRLYGGDFSFGINSGTLRYNVPMGSVHRFYHGTTNTVWIDDTGRLKATTFEGSGASLTNVPYASITSVPDFLLKTGGTLTGTLNGPTINATTALQEGGTNLTSKYLQLSGGSMTANANITLSGTGTFTGIHSGNGAALTNLPLSAYSTTGTDPNFLLKSGGTLTGNLTGTTINTSGNVGVGVSPSARLHIYEATGTVAGADAGSIIIDHDNSGGASSITFRSKANRGGGDYGYIQYQDAPTVNAAGENAKLIIGVQNDGEDDILLLPSGGVGINTATPSGYKLYVNGTTYFNGASTVNGTLTATTFSGSHTGNGSGLTSLTYGNITGVPDFLLKSGGTMTGGLTTTTLNTTGNVGIGGTLITVGGGTTATILHLTDIATAGWKIQTGGYNLSFLNDNPTSGTFVNKMVLTNAGNLSTTGTISEGGTLLTSKYLQLAGGTMTGALINTASTTSQFKAIEIAHPARTTHIPYLPNNQIYFRAPVIIDNDADFLSMGSRLGDSIIRVFAENYSFGINSLTLRYNVPIDAAHRFYTGTNNIFTINSSGVKFNNLVQNKVISLWDVAPANDFQFSGLGTNGGLTLNIPNNSTDSIIFKAGASATATSELMRIQGSGNIGIGTNNPRSLLHIKGTNTTLTIMGQGGSGAKSQINLSTYDHTTNLAPCSLIATDNGNFGSTFQINQKTSGADTNAQFISFIIYPSGNVGINTNNPQYKLQVEGTTYFNGASIVNGNLKINSGLVGINNGSEYAITNNFMPSGSLTIGGTNANFGCQFYSGGAWSGNNTAGLMMECADNTEIVVHDSGTRLVSPMAYYGGGTNRIYIGRDMGWGSTPITIPSNLTINGSLNIAANVWTYDTDGRQRIYFGGGGRTYYQGYGQYTADVNHEWRNHVGTGVMFLSYSGSLLLSGEIIPNMTSIGTSGTDCCGVSFNSSQGTTYQTSIKIIYGTFTGFHRCFTDDIEYNQEEPQKFKDDYVGRIVVSTGKIATDTKIENDEEWTIKYDKEGITIEDALPIIQLSRTKKDKRVFGVLGMPSRANSRVERMIVNSVGEGSIWICNSNGNIENGDYIQSSNHLGYGEKQEEIYLCNYTVAKATIDCNFELDSPLYECKELEEGLRIAFIACTYHSG